MDANPQKIVEEFYRCPYCNLYDDYDEEKVRDHMKTCSYNYNFPKRDCLTCKYRKVYSAIERCGHANGYRPLCKVSRSKCDKGFSMSGHMGYNACPYYEKKES